MKKIGAERIMYKILAMPYKTASTKLNGQQPLNDIAVFIAPDVHGSIEKLHQQIAIFFCRFFEALNLNLIFLRLFLLRNFCYEQNILMFKISYFCRLLY
jgi:hypothetical protein